MKSIGLKIEEIEPKANDCTEVLVWHTQTSKTKAPLVKITKDVLEHTKSNLLALLNTLSEMGVSHFSPSGGKEALFSIDFVVLISFTLQALKQPSAKTEKQNH